MVVNFWPLCLAEADIKQTNDSFWKIKNIFYSVLSKMCLDLCPPVYFQFSCHDSVFDIFKDTIKRDFEFARNLLTRIVSQIFV